MVQGFKPAKRAPNAKGKGKSTSSKARVGRVIAPKKQAAVQELKAKKVRNQDTRG